MLQNGTILSGNGEKPNENGVVVIQDGIITALGPESSVEVTRGAQVINVNGGTIMPGLIDTHVHVLNELHPDNGAFREISVTSNLERALAAGVTTMRDVGSEYRTVEDVAAIRNAFEALGNSVPNVVMTGPIIAHAESSFVKGFPSHIFGVATTGDAEMMAQEFIDAGVDQLKIMLHTREYAGPPRGETPDEIAPSLSLEQVWAIVEVAHQNGVWVTAHVVDPRYAELALAAGVDDLAHWPSATQALPEEILQTLAEINMPVVSTFTIYPAFGNDSRSFPDAGGVIVFGTDAPGTGALHCPIGEFMAMARAGMEPMEIIQSPTLHAARIAGLSEVVGTLEVGKQADIILLEGNPLEDISVMEDVVIVIKNGEWVVGQEGE